MNGEHNDAVAPSMVSRRLILAIVILGALVAMVASVYWVWLPSHDARIRRETADLLADAAQRELLADRIFWKHWLLKTVSSSSGIRYAHAIAVFREDSPEGCARLQALWRDEARQMARVIGPHYVTTVSECRSATLRLWEQQPPPPRWHRTPGSARGTTPPSDAERGSARADRRP